MSSQPSYTLEDVSSSTSKKSGIVVSQDYYVMTPVVGFDSYPVNFALPFTLDGVTFTEYDTVYTVNDKHIHVTLPIGVAGCIINVAH